ncbi:MAG: hypothetical protein Kapaf2KO_00050 [Candidatus Kapaibacteriales bacterium]
MMKKDNRYLDNKTIGIYLLIYIVLRTIQMPSIFLFDDSFITFRYAKNLFNGLGYIYNPGESFLGVTGPAWGVLCSIFYVLPEPETLIRLFNVFLSAGSLVIMAKLFDYDKIRFILAWLILIVTPYIIRINLGGMESDLFIFLSFLSIYVFKIKNNYYAIAIASLTYFIRPEAALLTIILSIIALKRDFRKALSPIIIGICVVLIGHLMIYLNYGNILPQSVVGKMDLGLGFLDTFQNLFVRDKALLAFFFLSLAGVYIEFRKGNLGIFHLFVLIYSLAYLFKSQMIFTWYIYPILFVYVDLASSALTNTFLKVFSFKKITLVLQIVSVITAALLSLYLYYYKSPNPVDVNIYSRLENYWDDGNGIGKTIFADDIGIIGYISQSYVYDSESLIHPIAKEYPYKLEVIPDKMPDFIFMNITPEVDSFFRANSVYHDYKPIKRFNREGNNDPTIILDSLTPGWEMDYFLLKRVD